ncbi:hypothetical protein HK096_004708 [Nowakowskiella sp. JEL0078]|nr:hypothetical protein HK096_004708 [Nowakowskiella sp. JEL0078]
MSGNCFQLSPHSICSPWKSLRPSVDIAAVNFLASFMGFNESVSSSDELDSTLNQWGNTDNGSDSVILKWGCEADKVHWRYRTSVVCSFLASVSGQCDSSNTVPFIEEITTKSNTSGVISVFNPLPTLCNSTSKAFINSLNISFNDPNSCPGMRYMNNNIIGWMQNLTRLVTSSNNSCISATSIEEVSCGFGNSSGLLKSASFYCSGSPNDTCCNSISKTSATSSTISISSTLSPSVTTKIYPTLTSSFSTSMLIGCIIGGVIFLVLLGTLAWYASKHKKRSYNSTAMQNAEGVPIIVLRKASLYASVDLSPSESAMVTKLENESQGDLAKELGTQSYNNNRQSRRSLNETRQGLQPRTFSEGDARLIGNTFRNALLSWFSASSNSSIAGTSTKTSHSKISEKNLSTSSINEVNSNWPASERSLRSLPSNPSLTND